MFAAATASSAEMCGVEGVDGLRIAHRWLARILLHLSEEVLLVLIVLQHYPLNNHEHRYLTDIMFTPLPCLDSCLLISLLI
jgi:hypothetical protein